MAVYAVSLRQLRAEKSKRAAAPVDPPADPLAATQQVPSVPPASLAEAPEAPQEATEHVLVSSSVEELLSLPRTELEALLAQSGAASSKVLLSLIFRLASLERQLEAVGVQARTAKVATIRAPSLPSPPVNFEAGTKSDLLEQVFRKNLSLRQGEAP